MSKRTDQRHERLLFRYSSALERGDFETVAGILREAERDPLLAQMIDEINAVYNAETTGSNNHLNLKELPMVTAVYSPAQRRVTKRLPDFSLTAAAALLLVALMGVILGTRIQGSGIWQSGGSNSPAAVGLSTLQSDRLCTATVVSDGDVRSRPMTTGIVIGTLAAGTQVDVYDMSVLDGTPAQAVAWYYVATLEVQGWVPRIMLDAAACPQPTLSPANVVSTPTPAPFSLDSALELTATPLPTLVPPVLEAAQPTATPFLPTIVPPELDAVQPTLIPLGRVEASAAIPLEPTIVPPPSLSVEAIVCASTTLAETEVRSLPSPDSTVLGQLAGGTPVLVRDTTTPADSEWYFVAANTVQGWIPAVTLENCVTTAPATASPTFDYQVQNGDTLLSILNQFNLDVSALPEIQQLNNLPNLSSIQPGMTLLLPLLQVTLPSATPIPTLMPPTVAPPTVAPIG